MKHKLLIVDDDDEIRTQMKWGLAEDYEIVLAGDRASALEVFQAEHPLVVLLDLGLPPRPGDPEEGLAALSEIVALERLTKVIVITGQGEKSIAMRALGSGAYDFLVKPIEMDELKVMVRRGVYVASLEVECRQMQSFIGGNTFEGMLGNSPAIRAVFDSIRKVATTDAPVLLLGESGTGKEMAAKAIHQASARKDGEFIAINCSAIPETLLESELFGHEKGSFTGAHAQRKGRFEMANGGTLFLDEIGEIPLPLQVKLLRFLQEQCIERVGGRQSIPIDARVVTATNADLRKGMVAGTFREGLLLSPGGGADHSAAVARARRRPPVAGAVLPATVRRAKRQDGIVLRPGRFARPRPLPLAGQCAPIRKPGAARGHYGRRQAIDCKGLGINFGNWSRVHGQHERRPGKPGTGNDPGRPQKAQWPHRPSRRGLGHQPSYFV